MTRMLWILSIAALLSTSLGCQSLESWDLFSPLSDAAPTGKPTEVGAIWQDGVDVQLDRQNGGLPIPGFAGRVFFMQERKGQHAQTVLVDGTVVVSLYDDRPTQGPPTPLETWTILPEHLTLLVRKDMTGWGYSLWLPWHTYHPEIRNVRMVVQYNPKDGSVPLMGDPSPLRIREANPGGRKPELKVAQDQKKTWQ